MRSKLVKVDFSKAEIIAVQKGKPKDIHAAAAMKIFGVVTPETRRVGKVANFLIMYGANFPTVLKEVKKCLD